MRRLIWNELAKNAQGIFWRTYDKRLNELAKVVIELESQQDPKTKR